MKILFVSNKYTIENKDGSGVLVWDFLEWFLQAGTEVHFVSAAKFASRGFALRQFAARLPSGVIERLPGFFRLSRRWISFLPWVWFRRFLKGKIDQTEYGYYQIMPPEIAERLASFIERKGFDAVIVSYAWCAPVLGAIKSPLIRKGIIAHDIWQKRAIAWQASGAPPDFPLEIVSRENELLAMADFVCVETPEDKTFVTQRVPTVDTFLMPRAILPNTTKAAHEGKTLLFVGGAAAHNVQGILWFLEKVWPIILSTCVDARLVLIGRVTEEVKMDYPNTDLTGVVDDLAPFYRNATVCIIPLLAGSGFKTKLIEALSFGKATVSTPIGAQGLNHLSDPPLLISGTEQQFASSVITLLTNSQKRTHLAQKAINYIEEFHSSRAIYSPILNYLRKD